MTRFSAAQERIIARDGTNHPVGRSLTYRFGAFHGLGLAALRGLLPSGLPPSQVRCALDAVLERHLAEPALFDASGWLRIGLSGWQPALAERYISTGSLYLFTTGFVPLGLPAECAFWSGPDLPWTAVRAWSGEDLPADVAAD